MYWSTNPNLQSLRKLIHKWLKWDLIFVPTVILEDEKPAIITVGMLPWYTLSVCEQESYIQRAKKVIILSSIHLFIQFLKIY